jgi:RNA polymerase sigma-70 factor (ECF subfamily)
MVVTTLEGTGAVPADVAPVPDGRRGEARSEGAPVQPGPTHDPAGEADGRPDDAPAPVPAPPTWDDVVRDHGQRVYRLAYRLTGNKHDAEDLTQEVFVRVFRSLSKYTPGTFEGWLHRITTNLFLDQVRRKRRIRFDALPEDAADRLPGSDVAPDQRHADRSFDGDIQAALDALAPEFRAAVVLCDIEGLSYEEVAAALDIKLGTVRSRIHRGRAQLRAALAHRAPRTGTATRLPVPADGGGS